MRKSTLFKKVSIGLAALFLLSFLGLGCASEEQIKAHREAAEVAAKKAEDAAARAEAAAKRAEDAATKSEKTFEKSLQK
jgi:membrane protein required for beta-lactamase induction